MPCGCPQVDIFSLAVIMYELFVMSLVAIINNKSGLPDEYEQYARRVAGGYREKLRDTWPQGLKVQCRRYNSKDLSARLQIVLQWWLCAINLASWAQLALHTAQRTNLPSHACIVLHAKGLVGRVRSHTITVCRT